MLYEKMMGFSARIVKILTLVLVATVGCSTENGNKSEERKLRSERRNIVFNPLTDQNYVFSEQSFRQQMQKAAGTKTVRIQQAFEQVADNGAGGSFRTYFAKLWLGKDLDQVNEDLLNIFTTEDKEIRGKYGLEDYWHLSANQWLYHMYYAFGAEGTVSSGRLYPKTEKALLELLWQRMKYKDDIHLARESTWWMAGSENHDIVAKVSSLITSQIFMNEPEFKDRVYPDLGIGGGYKFWFHQMYGDEDEEYDGPKPRGHSNDNKTYTAADHS